MRELSGKCARITLLPGWRDETIEILRESAAGMPGCPSYVVAKDTADENTSWATEVWNRMASHDTSLFLPLVKNAILEAKQLFRISRESPITSPVWETGLPAAHAP
jgi:quinol monooxygenase YgiN